MAALTNAQLADFQRDGYLAVENLLDLERDVQPVVDEYRALLDELCRAWVAEGRLEQTFSDLPFEQRLVEIYRSGCQYAQPLDISLPGGEITEQTPIHNGQAVFDLMRSPRLLDAIESIIGPEIYSNPIQHVRIKPPRNVIDHDDRDNSMLAKTEWHQDQGVTMPEADATNMVTAWVAITDATLHNGCLHVIPRSHLGEMVPHCPGLQLSIPEGYVEPECAVPVPVRRGGVVFFHPLSKHGSRENHSNVFRWSFDLRYNRIGEPTGRSFFPGFVARSRANPDAELHDVQTWARSWRKARRDLAAIGSVTLHRWDGNAPLCA